MIGPVDRAESAKNHTPETVSAPIGRFVGEPFADRGDGTVGGVLDRVRAAHHPSGRRLGIAVGMPSPAELLDGLASILADSGQSPPRRLARLRPRPGETTTRAQDVAWFVERFGHEYTVIVLAPEMLSPQGETACRAEHCTVILTDGVLPDCHPEATGSN